MIVGRRSTSEVMSGAWLTNLIVMALFLPIEPGGGVPIFLGFLSYTSRIGFRIFRASRTPERTLSLLVIGGTRNLGHLLVLALREAGHRVTVLNRGVTPDTLPRDVERLRADRTDPRALAVALKQHDWEAVVDLACYSGPEAEAAVDLLRGQTGRYIFIGTGQVYLVRTEVRRPSREGDYAGPLLSEPPAGTRDHDNWRYGIGKREAEDVLAEAWSRSRFPYTSLRLPMVHSPRDHYGRIHNYLLRLLDGGPILLPDGGDLSVQHVVADDVVGMICRLINSDAGVGDAYNLAQPDVLTVEEALGVMAEAAGVPLRVQRVSRVTLDAQELLPACSPFSDPWMSALDSSRAAAVLGFQGTPMGEYLPRLVEHYTRSALPPPVGYAQRKRELALRNGVMPG